MKRYEPLGHYNYLGRDYIVFAKRKKNGLVVFKTKRMQGLFNDQERFFPHDIINVEKQWEKIINN